MIRVKIADGVDVSIHQCKKSKIDWNLVRSAGYEFAIIRIGFRGYGKAGNITVDKAFEDNIRGASEAGMKLGFYFYSQALNEREAVAEAEFCIEKILNYECSLFVAYDLEGYTLKDFRTYGITKEQRTKNCKAFNERLKQFGYNGILYGSRSCIKSKFNLEEFDELLWVAKYPSKTKVLKDDKHFPNLGTALNPRIAMWQYTSIGQVPGINAKVDLDMMYIPIYDGAGRLEQNPYKVPTKTVKYNTLTQYVALQDVMWLQWELKEAGYAVVVDGKFGKITLAALKSYQNLHQLEVDGKCGPLTRAEMLKD